MLEEAVEVIRLLWQGGYQTYRGKHYTVERARIYTLPDRLPEICLAAAQPNASGLAARRSGHTRMRASTTSTSIRSARIKTASSTSAQRELMPKL